MDEFVELDEEKIENLDTELNKKYEEAKNDFIILDKKLKKSRIINVILSIFLVISLIITIVLSVLFYNSFISFNPFIKHFFKNNVNLSTISQITTNNPIDLQKFAEKLSFIDDVVGEMYYYEKDNKKIEDGMFAGYLNALGDKYAEYYPAKEYTDFSTEMTEGVYYGIGCTVTFDSQTRDCKVQQVYEDSPAEKGGLKVGDIFVSVDGENIRGKDTEYLVSKIKGPEGTERTIEVFRPNMNKNVTLTCFCGKVDIKLIDYKMVEDNIAYLDVDQFTGKAATQFKKAIDNIVEDKAEGLIIDLRGNGGGELMTILSMLDYLVRDKDGRYTLNQKEELFESGKTLLVYIKEKEEILDSAYAYDNHSLEIPIVVLTDVTTASAAELFTEALRDYKKAIIVGTRTFGKGVVQNVIECDDGSAIKFTTSEYFPPSGYSIDKRGILPDYSLDINGNEIQYNEDNKIVVTEEDGSKQYIIDIDGSIIDELELNVATKSDTSFATKSDIKLAHAENLKIYDEQNSFINEEWFADLDDNYEDKQMLQAIIVLKDKLSKN